MTESGIIGNERKGDIIIVGNVQGGCQKARNTPQIVLSLTIPVLERDVGKVLSAAIDDSEIPASGKLNKREENKYPFVVHVIGEGDTHERGR